MVDYRGVAGLPSGGASGATNAGRFVSVGIVSDPTGIQIRRALAINSHPGGIPEMLVPNPREQIMLVGVYGVTPPY